jgi:signal transduction histidine kinase
VAQFLARRSPLARDLMIAGAALALILSAMLAARSAVWFPLNPGGYYGVAVVTAVAWPLSRLAPKSTLVVIAAVTVLLPQVFEYVAQEVRIVPFIVAAFRAAQLGGVKKYVIPFVAVAAPFVVERDLPGLIQDGNLLPPEYGFSASGDVMLLAFVAAMVGLGYALRSQRLIAENLNLQIAELIALRASEGERVAAEVQTAIARDIHDVVAHHVAAMVVTAQAADRIADRDPERLRATVRAIAADGNDALAAMRRVVEILRHRPNDARKAETFETALGELTGRLSASGRNVTVTGEISGATEFVQETVLRIVQESLTNVMLHSDAKNVALSFAARGNDIEVRVEDDGRRGGTKVFARGGNGIGGMRERALAVGGRLTAGPREENGWAVHAVLPRTGNAVAA